jgi:hypothetical protein
MDQALVPDKGSIARAEKLASQFMVVKDAPTPPHLDNLLVRLVDIANHGFVPIFVPRVILLEGMFFNYFVVFVLLFLEFIGPDLEAIRYIRHVFGPVLIHEQVSLEEMLCLQFLVELLQLLSPLVPLDLELLQFLGVGFIDLFVKFFLHALCLL